MKKARTYPNGHKFTIRDFNNIKDLLGYQLPKKKVIELSGWSYSTIARVSASKNFEQYIELNEQRLKNNKNKQQELPTPKHEPSTKAIFQNQWLEAIRENTKEVKMLREAIYVVRNDNKKGWFK